MPVPFFTNATKAEKMTIKTPIELTNDERKILDAIGELSLDADRAEFFARCVAVRMKSVNLLNLALEGSKDRVAENDLTQFAITQTLGAGYVLTAHGIQRPIPEKYSIEKRRKIVDGLLTFSQRLSRALSIQSFVTSGTLLGVWRDGDFIAYDDDFDMAYVSNFSAQEEVALERVAITQFFEDDAQFQLDSREGTKFWVDVNFEGVEFGFDLFTGFRVGRFFNVFPLKPNTIPIDAILPTKIVNFLERKVPVPQDPEMLLAINYGQGWRTPDPTFRFNYGAHRKAFLHLLENDLASKKKKQSS